MKRAAIAMILLPLLVGGCLGLALRLRAATGRIEAALDAVERAVEAENEEEIGRAVEAACRRWEAEKTLLIAVAGRAGCEPADRLVAALPAVALADLPSNVASLRNDLEELQGLQWFRWVNLL